MDLKKILKLQGTGESLTAFFEQHPSRNLLLLFFLLVIYALIIFGFYAIGRPIATENATGLEINTELYQKVLTRLKERGDNIRRGTEQNYPDIFK